MSARELGNPLGNPLALRRASADISSVGAITTRTTGPAANEMEADGRQLLKAAYSKLYAAIGDAYSVADFTAGAAAVTLSASSTWVSLAYGNGLFVAISAAGLTSVSADEGATWQAGESLPAGTWSSIAFGGGKFAAVASSGATAASLDGTGWAAGMISGGAAVGSLCWGAGAFLLVRAGSGSSPVSRSVDGVDWATVGTIASAATSFSVVWGGGIFVAVRTGSSTNNAFSSVDGASWTARNLPSSTTWSSVAYGNGAFVAVSVGTGVTSATSSDGITWRNGSGATQSAVVAFGAGNFVISFAASATLGYSKDGVGPWPTISMPAASFLALAFGRNALVGVRGGTDAAVRINITSPIYFGLPSVKPYDSRSAAYIKVS